LNTAVRDAKARSSVQETKSWETPRPSGEPSIRDDEVELVEWLGNNDLCPTGPGALSRTAAATAVAFDGVGRDYYVRE
jgi:hypothetical protein